MQQLIRSNDCAPIAPNTRATLSDAQLRRLRSAQQTLLAPFDHSSLSGWRVAVVREVASALGGDVGAFQLHLPGEDREVGVGVPQDHLGQWVDHLPDLPAGFDLHERMLQVRVGTRFTTWGRHLEWFYDTPYFNEFLVNVGGFDPLAITAPAPGPAGNANVRIHHSTMTGPRFGAEELLMARLLHPAFEAGVAMAVRVARSRSSLIASLDAQRDGSLVFDFSGRLLLQNRAVTQSAPTAGGESAIAAAARAMVLGLGSTEVHDALLPRHTIRTVRHIDADYRLTATVLGEGIFALRPVVLVTVSRCDRSLPDRARLKERFGLTRRQAEVALLLAQRMTDREVAERLCISHYTARGHAEAVMAKLGVHNRREIAPVLENDAGGQNTRW